MEQFNHLIEQLTQRTQNLPGIKDIAQKAGVSTGHISLGLIVLFITFMLLGIGADLITDAIGLFYPMYMSFKALETKEGDDDKLWLTYWVVYACYKVVDEWSETLFYWVPFYYPIKLMFLVFLFAPQTRGAVKLYDNLIKPFMLKHQQEIDSGMNTLGEATSIASRAFKEEALKRGTDYVMHHRSE